MHCNSFNILCNAGEFATNHFEKVLTKNSLENTQKLRLIDARKRRWGTKTSSRDASRTKNEQALYIVILKTAAVTQYEGRVDNLAATQPRTGERFKKYDSEVLKHSSHLEQMHGEILRECGAKLGDKVCSYTFSTNGFASKLLASLAVRLQLKQVV